MCPCIVQLYIHQEVGLNMLRLHRRDQARQMLGLDAEGLDDEGNPMQHVSESDGKMRAFYTTNEVTRKDWNRLVRGTPPAQAHAEVCVCLSHVSCIRWLGVCRTRGHSTVTRSADTQSSPVHASHLAVVLALRVCVMLAAFFAQSHLDVLLPRVNCI